MPHCSILRGERLQLWRQNPRGEGTWLPRGPAVDAEEQVTDKASRPETQDSPPWTGGPQHPGMTTVTPSAVCANGCRADTGTEHPLLPNTCIQLHLRHHSLPVRSPGLLGPLSDLHVSPLLCPCPWLLPHSPCQALGTKLLFRRTLVFNLLVS